jgi:hypothetical protein
MANELMVEEYKSLRREILQLAGSISRWQLVGIITGGIGLAWVAFSSWNLAWAGFGTGLMLPVLGILAGCIFGIIHDLRSILRIAAYIQAAHEGKDTGALWETRQEMIAGADISNPLRPYMTPILSLLWIGFLCAVIPAAVNIYQFKGNVLAMMRDTHVMGDLVGIMYFIGINAVVGSVIILALWLIFWCVIRRSYRPMFSGEFKHKTMDAFFTSMRQAGKDEPGVSHT